MCVMGRGSKNVFRYRLWGQEVVFCEKMAAVIGVVFTKYEMGERCDVTQRACCVWRVRRFETGIWARGRRGTQVAVCVWVGVHFEGSVNGSWGERGFETRCG